MGNSVTKQNMGNSSVKLRDDTDIGSTDHSYVDSCSVGNSVSDSCSIDSWNQTFYTMGATKGDGSSQLMSAFHGKVIYAVNVASKWGLTKREYKQFVKLNKKYGDKLVILGFPTREYAWQEYKSDEAIAKFAAKKNFPGIMMQLGKLKGNNAPELWKFFKDETGAKDPKWNFQGKFLISKTGIVTVSNAKDLEDDIERLVAEEYEEDLAYKEFLQAVTDVWR